MNLTSLARLIWTKKDFGAGHREVPPVRKYIPVGAHQGGTGNHGGGARIAVVAAIQRLALTAPAVAVEAAVPVAVAGGGPRGGGGGGGGGNSGTMVVAAVTVLSVVATETAAVAGAHSGQRRRRCV